VSVRASLFVSVGPFLGSRAEAAQSQYLTALTSCIDPGEPIDVSYLVGGGLNRILSLTEYSVRAGGILPLLE
jgi:hypothetical protein